MYTFSCTVGATCYMRQQQQQQFWKRLLMLWCYGASGLRCSEFAICFVCAFYERKCKQCTNMQASMCMYVFLLARWSEKSWGGSDMVQFFLTSHTHTHKNSRMHEIFWKDFRFGNVTVMNVDLISVEWRCSCAGKKISELKAPKKITF